MLSNIYVYITQPYNSVCVYCTIFFYLYAYIQYWSDCIVLDIFKLRFLSSKSGAIAK